MLCCSTNTNMLMLEISLFLLYIVQRDCAYESSQDYDDDDDDEDYHDLGQSEGHLSSELEQQLRSVSSVDELMTILYPEHWKMLKCHSMKGSRAHDHFREVGLDTATEEPVTFAAIYSNPEILRSIDIEWKKTQCMPREVCLDVGKEFGSPTNTIFKPSCVSIYRCGGCCNSEGLICTNTSTSHVPKSLFEIVMPLSQGAKPVTISVANHTSCRCMSKLDHFRQIHSIIRRSLPTSHSDCHKTNKTCSKNHTWNNYFCRCVLQHDFSSFMPPKRDTDGDTGFHVCGPNKELDEDTCQCVCKGGLHHSSCGAHKELDKELCQCVCRNGLYPGICGPHRQFDADSCECICKKSCPRNHPLNPAKCVCECTESPNKCFLKGKRFHPQTCSCFRPPCVVRTRRCSQGYYFSEEVCRCIPLHWRRSHIDYY
ncbi:vascular endothelial growth factor C [Callorhinchus milii]|uniref:Vascular endothelial growth factor C n=1 Tax=Callorhinchus milii TaxID=7868 RepID=V9KK18_CALMI|nr:vascular endothelial growth factor C [Callorhinchus milii]|eukprot:gi/632956751/ref/XP_007894115.1/ PREDICTED: vascular endothelial growth factor C [Callorhinchus milii]